MTEDAASSTFSFAKREFLLSKLDEIIKLWARGIGQGSFYFTVNDGNPNLQFGLHVDLEDDPVPVLQDPQHQYKQKRVRGPAQQAKNRERAIAHQLRLKNAAGTAASDAAITAASRSPALGSALSTAASTAVSSSAVTPDASSGTVEPPTPAVPAPSTAASAMSSSTNSTASSAAAPPATSLPTLSSLSPSFPGVGRPLAEIDSYCSWCRSTFDRRSSPASCSRCQRFFHKKCHGGHSCDPPD